MILTLLALLLPGSVLIVAGDPFAAKAQVSPNSGADFNGDGYSDLAILASTEKVGNVGLAGAVNVLYGSSSGLQTSSPADQFWHQNSPGVDDMSENGDGSGSTLATGDFNGDGFSDLAVGFPSESVGSIGTAGAVNVLYGSSSGLQTSSPADQFWHQDSLGVENTVEADDRFGSTLASGDFNNDGLADLAIGVPNESIGSIGTSGAVNVLYGSSSGLQTSSPADQFWHQGKPGVEDVEEAGDGFGSALVGGDFNGDTYFDLAVGVRGEDLSSVQDAGAVNVLYGSSSGLQTSSPADQFWHQNSPNVESGPRAHERFGYSLTSGNFNNDAFSDLAIGVPFETVGTVTDAGAVNVLYGSSSGLQTSSPADQFWHQNSPGIEDSAEIGNAFGSPLSACDFSNDGSDDLAVGVVGEDIGGLAAGAVNVLYGSSSGLQTSSPADQFWHQNSPGVDDVIEHGDLFADSITAGDFNNDGSCDLAIGVPSEKLGSVPHAGAVHVLYGSPSRLQVSTPATQFWNQDTAGVEDVVEFTDRFGDALS